MTTSEYKLLPNHTLIHTVEVMPHLDIKTYEEWRCSCGEEFLKFENVLAHAEEVINKYGSCRL